MIYLTVWDLLEAERLSEEIPPLRPRFGAIKKELDVIIELTVVTFGGEAAKGLRLLPYGGADDFEKLQLSETELTYFQQVHLLGVANFHKHERVLISARLPSRAEDKLAALLEKYPELRRGNQ